GLSAVFVPIFAILFGDLHKMKILLLIVLVVLPILFVTGHAIYNPDDVDESTDLKDYEEEDEEDNYLNDEPLFHDGSKLIPHRQLQDYLYNIRTDVLTNDDILTLTDKKKNNAIKSPPVSHGMNSNNSDHPKSNTGASETVDYGEKKQWKF